MHQIFVGDDVLVDMEFTNKKTGELVDPTSITVNVTSPSGIQSALTYPGTIVLNEVGKYTATIDVTEYGKWKGKVLSTGPGKGGKPFSFEVTADSDAQ